MSTIISEIFIINEHERTSELFHPEIQNLAVDLYLKVKERLDIRAYLVRQSFLLVSADWYINEAVNLGKNLIPKDGKPNSNEPSGACGRGVYPIFSSINSFLSVAHKSMNYSIALISAICSTSNWGWSIHWANTKGKEQLLKYAGQDITNLITNSWVWASELRDYRDLMEHYNPLHTQPVIEFTSSNGILFDSFKCLLPKKPGSRRISGDKQEWGIDAIGYCFNLMRVNSSKLCFE
jgi:hypothetical protein